MIGVESLRRLEQDGRILKLDVFLPSLSVHDLDALLFRSLRFGVEVLGTCHTTHLALHLLVNVRYG